MAAFEYGVKRPVKGIVVVYTTFHKTSIFEEDTPFTSYTTLETEEEVEPFITKLLADDPSCYIVEGSIIHDGVEIPFEAK